MMIPSLPGHRCTSFSAPEYQASETCITELMDSEVIHLATHLGSMKDWMKITSCF